MTPPIAVLFSAGSNRLHVHAFGHGRPSHALVSDREISSDVARSLAGRYHKLADVKIAGQSFGLQLARFNRQ